MYSVLIFEYQYILIASILIDHFREFKKKNNMIFL